MAPEPVSKTNAEHYVWGGKCDGWHLVKNSQLSVIQECMPPGAAELRHYHEKAQQFFYVLSGEAAMEVGGRLIKVGTGQGIHIPPGLAHQMKNDSEQDLHFLVISQPPSHGDRVAVPSEKA